MKQISILTKGAFCPLFVFAVLLASTACGIDMAITPTVTPPKYGSVSPQTTTLKKAGDEITFVALANPGYRFVDWMITNANNVDVAKDGISLKVTRKSSSSLSPSIMANFTFGIFTVAFDPCGGALIGDASITVTNATDGATLTVPSAIRTGYSLSGWTTNNVVWAVKTGSRAWLTADVNAKAEWMPNTYRITYDTNNGSGKTAYEDVRFNENYNVPSSDPKWEGHIFAGWFTERVGGTEVDSYTRLTRSENHSVYAHWTVGKYKVTFDPEGGEVSPIFSNVEFDSPYGELPMPTREGFDFVEWRTKSGTPVNAETKVLTAADHTLYAAWKGKTYSVKKSVLDGSELMVESSGQFEAPLSFSWKGGKKTGYTATNTIAVVSATTGGMVLAAYTNLTSASYTMIGAYYQSITISVTSLFRPNTYRVSFDSRGGSSVSAKDITYDAVYGELPTPTRMGYAFGGWFTAEEGGNEIKSDTKVAITESQILYARWMAKSYTVTTKVNGAISLTVNKIGIFDQPLSIGWMFNALAGYSNRLDKVQIRADESGAGEVLKTYTSGTGVEFTMKDLNNFYSSIVIEASAISRPNSYSVKFDANGARGKMNPLACTYDLTFDLPKQNSYTNLTAKFLGWVRDPKATAIEWTDEAKGIKNLTEVDGGEVTLYAVWQDMQNELTRAAHGINVIITTSGTYPFIAYTNELGQTAARSGAFDYPNSSQMSLTVKGPGTLSFLWKSTNLPANSFMAGFDTTPQFLETWGGTPIPEGWTAVSVEFEGAQDHTATWYSVSVNPSKDYLLVDKIEWKPAGWTEKPTDADRRDLATIALADGELSLSFADSDPRFAYSLHGTNDLGVARALWPVILSTNGTGSAITIKPKMKADELKFFYYLEVHSK